MITLGYSVVAVIELISYVHLWVCQIDVKVSGCGLAHTVILQEEINRC